MQRTSWTIIEPGKPRPERPKVVKKDRLLYLKPFPISEKMTAQQKQTAENYNLMQKTLIDHGLMEEK